MMPAADAWRHKAPSFCHSVQLHLTVLRCAAQHDAATEFLSTVQKTFGSAYSKAGGLQVAAVSRHAIAQRFQALSAIQPGIVKVRDSTIGAAAFGYLGGSYYRSCFSHDHL